MIELSFMPGMATVLATFIIVVAALTDYRDGQIDDALTYPAIVFGFLLSSNLLLSVFTAIIFGGLFYLAAKKKWAGAGDVALMVALSLLSPVLTVSALICGCLCCLLCGLWMWVTCFLGNRNIIIKKKLPFAPFFAFGWFMAVVVGNFYRAY